MNFDHNDAITIGICVVLAAMAVYAFMEPLRKRRLRKATRRLGIAIQYALYREAMRQRASGCRN